MLSEIYPVVNENGILQFCIIKSVLGGRPIIATNIVAANWIKIHEDNDFMLLLCREQEFLNFIDELMKWYPQIFKKIDAEYPLNNPGDSHGVKLRLISDEELGNLYFALDLNYNLIVYPSYSKKAVLVRLVEIISEREEIQEFDIPSDFGRK